MAKKKQTPTETRLEVRLNPHIANQLKETAKETGVSLNQLMRSICTWATSNIHVGMPNIQDDLVLGSKDCDGMFWIGRNFDQTQHLDGDVYAVFDFSTNRAIRDPHEFYYPEEDHP
jgi:hypothetical protein